jgi:hypothetical protein
MPARDRLPARDEAVRSWLLCIPIKPLSEGKSDAGTYQNRDAAALVQFAYTEYGYTDEMHSFLFCLRIGWWGVGSGKRNRQRGNWVLEYMRRPSLAAWPRCPAWSWSCRRGPGLDARPGRGRAGAGLASMPGLVVVVVVPARAWPRCPAWSWSCRRGPGLDARPGRGRAGAGLASMPGLVVVVPARAWP